MKIRCFRGKAPVVSKAFLPFNKHSFIKISAVGERGDLKILFFAYRKIINLIFENITIWIVVFVFFFILSGPP